MTKEDAGCSDCAVNNTQVKTVIIADSGAAAVPCPDTVSDDKEKLIDKEKSAKGRGQLLKQHELTKERESPASDTSSLT